MPHTNEEARVGKTRTPQNASLGSENGCGSNTATDGGTQDVLIGDLQKNRREIVRIQLREFKGADLADIRVHFPDDETGALRPTGKGIALKPALLPKLITLLQSAEIEARKAGLL